MNRTLILAPHHDDAEFGLGGYIARMVEDFRNGVGQMPGVAIFCTGDYQNTQGVPVRQKERVEETIAAMEVLGGVEIQFMNAFTENKFDLAGRVAIVGMIDMALEGPVEYTDVMCCLPSYNQDHRALWEAFITAFRPGRHAHIKRIWGYPYQGNCHGPDGLPTGVTTGKCYIKLTQAHFNKKVGALLEHKSQNFSFDICSGVEGQMRASGSECGAEYAEVVYMIREIY